MITVFFKLLYQCFLKMSIVFLNLILIPFRTVGLVFWVQSLFKLWVLRQFKKGLV